MSKPTKKDMERAAAWLATMSPGAMCPTDVVIDANADGRADERARIVAALRAVLDRDEGGSSAQETIEIVADRIESGEL